MGKDAEATNTIGQVKGRVLSACDIKSRKIAAYSLSDCRKV
jgi:hypothetical protein